MLKMMMEAIKKIQIDRIASFIYNLLILKARNRLFHFKIERLLF